MKLNYILAMCFIFLFNTFNALSQTTNVSNNSIAENGKDILYAELVGSSGIYSINYERIFHTKNIFQFSTRVGFGAFPIAYKGKYSDGYLQTDFISSNIVIPIEGIFSFGKKTSHFDVGVGVTQLIRWMVAIENPFNLPRQSLYNRYYVGPVISVGYRYEKKGGGFFLRAGLSTSCLFATNPSEDALFSGNVLPLPQICLGYKLFRRKK